MENNIISTSYIENFIHIYYTPVSTTLVDTMDLDLQDLTPFYEVYQIMFLL